MGRQLMQQLRDHCVELGCRKILVTLQSCLRGHAGFYKKVGFQQAAANDNKSIVEMTLFVGGTGAAVKPTSGQLRAMAEAEAVEKNLEAVAGAAHASKHLVMEAKGATKSKHKLIVSKIVQFMHEQDVGQAVVAEWVGLPMGVLQDWLGGVQLEAMKARNDELMEAKVLKMFEGFCNMDHGSPKSWMTRTHPAIVAKALPDDFLESYLDCERDAFNSAMACLRLLGFPGDAKERHPKVFLTVDEELACNNGLVVDWQEALTVVLQANFLKNLTTDDHKVVGADAVLFECEVMVWGTPSGHAVLVINEGAEFRSYGPSVWTKGSPLSTSSAVEFNGVGPNGAVVWGPCGGAKCASLLGGIARVEQAATDDYMTPQEMGAILSQLGFGEPEAQSEQPSEKPSGQQQRDTRTARDARAADNITQLMEATRGLPSAQVVCICSHPLCARTHTLCLCSSPLCVCICTHPLCFLCVCSHCVDKCRRVQ